MSYVYGCLRIGSSEFSREHWITPTHILWYGLMILRKFDPHWINPAGKPWTEKISNEKRITARSYRMSEENRDALLYKQEGKWWYGTGNRRVIIGLLIQLICLIIYNLCGTPVSDRTLSNMVRPNSFTIRVVGDCQPWVFWDKGEMRL